MTAAARLSWAVSYRHTASEKVFEQTVRANDPDDAVAAAAEKLARDLRLTDKEFGRQFRLTLVTVADG